MPTPHPFSQSQRSASGGQNSLLKLKHRRRLPAQPGCYRGTDSLAPCPAQVRLEEISPAPPATLGGHSSPPGAPAELQATSLGSRPPPATQPLGPAGRTPSQARRGARAQRRQSHGGPGPPHWLRPGQSRRSQAAVGPRAAAPARARSPCYALSNSPRYRVMCCCSRRRRCRRPGCPGSSAALRGGSRGRGRGLRVQGAARLRGASRCSRRPPQVMPPPPASA